MTDSIISPDGKFMWTGTEWIPAPPSSSHSAKVNLQDSVVGGDINITQNNAEDIAAAMVQALERLGFSGQSTPVELTPYQDAEVEKVFEMSEQCSTHGFDIDPWIELDIAKMAHHTGKDDSAKQIILRALENFRKNGDKDGEATALYNLGVFHYTRGEMLDAERMYRESMNIRKEIGNNGPQENAETLGTLGQIAEARGDMPEAERLHRDALSLWREIGNKEKIASSLVNLGNCLLNRDMSERHRCYTEAVQIHREIGFPIDKWFIDNGY